MKLDNVKLKKIKGDASFRTFYRKKNAKKNSIIVFSSKGFANLASKIVVVIPFFLRISEAFLHS